MQTYLNDPLLATHLTPADYCDPIAEDLDLKMCAETYNEISQWVLDAITPEQIGQNALCIMRYIYEPALPIEVLFSNLETPKSQAMARQALIKIFNEIKDSESLRIMGMKAYMLFTCIRPEHSRLTGSLNEIGASLGCTKQNISQQQDRYRKKLGVCLRTKGKRKLSAANRG
jgi:hypothetical protein